MRRALSLGRRDPESRDSRGDLDVVIRPPGIKGYAELRANAVSYDLGGLRVHMAAIEDLIRTKQATAREKDLAVLPTLRALLRLARESGRGPSESMPPVT